MLKQQGINMKTTEETKKAEKVQIKAIILTAHGTTVKDLTITLPIDLITSCKIGETHQGKHLSFANLSIFSNKYFLYDYLLTGNEGDYTNQGEVITQSTPIPHINLLPCSSDQYIKKWSWQKPYVLEHFRKMCIYDIKDIPGNPYKIDYTNVNSITLSGIASETSTDPILKKNFKLVNQVSILNDYNINTVYKPSALLDSFHVASVTTIRNSGIMIFDYETGPSAITNKKEDDIWPLSDAITSISTYCTNNDIDLTGVDSFILKACLE